MALINCPECGESVSSLAKKCVQCGCTIHVCKECETVWAGNQTTCPECGYAIDQESEKVVEKQTAASNQSNTYLVHQNYMQMANNPFQNLNQENVAYTIYKNIPFGQRFATNIFMHLSWMVLILMGVILLIWSNSLEMVLTKSDDIASLCRALVVVSFGLLLVGKTYGKYKQALLVNQHLVSYLANYNVDLTNEIRTLYGCNWLGLTQKEKYVRVVNIDYFMHVAMQLENPSHKIYPDTKKRNYTHHQNPVAFYAFGVLSMVSVIIDYGILFWSVENVLMKGFLVGFDVAIKEAILSIDISKVFGILFWMLIALFMLGAIFFVLGAIFKDNKKLAVLRTWVEKNIPDQKDNFEKYNITNTTPIGMNNKKSV